MESISKKLRLGTSATVRTARRWSGRTVGLTAAMVCGLVLAGCGSSSDDNGDGGESGGDGSSSEIVIGSIGTYSGTFAAVTGGSPAAVKAWAEEVNANGGIDGHHVRVVVADDGGNATTAATAAMKMIQEDKVIAFVGNQMPSTAAAVVKVAEQSKVPIIGGDGTFPEVWNSSPYVFPISATLQEQNAAVVKLAKDAGVTKLGYWWCTEVCKDTVSNVEAAADVIGGVEIAPQGVSLTQTNFSANCIKAKNDGVDGLSLLAPAPAYASTIEQCAAQGFEPLKIGVSGTYNELALDSASELEGLRVYSTVFPWNDTSTPARQEFHDAWEKHAPDDTVLGLKAAEGWAAAETFAATADSWSDNPTAADVMKGLWAFDGYDNDGLTIPLTYQENEPADPFDCIFAAEIKDGQWAALYDGEPICGLRG